MQETHRIRSEWGLPVCLPGQSRGSIQAEFVQLRREEIKTVPKSMRSLGSWNIARAASSAGVFGHQVQTCDRSRQILEELLVQSSLHNDI
jgi:hypothetical protein